MARGGQNAKPAEQRRREGNPGKRPINDPVLVGERLTGTDLDETAGELVEGSLDAPLKLPAVPNTLALVDELDDVTDASDLWREVCTLLITSGIITAGDLFAVEQFVMSVLEARRAFFELRTEGSTVETANDSGNRAARTTHPAYRVWRDANSTMLRWAEHLGLTPVARTRLGLSVAKGRKLVQELERGLPEQPLQRSGAEAAQDTEAVDIYESEAP